MDNAIIIMKQKMKKINFIIVEIERMKKEKYAELVLKDMNWIKMGYVLIMEIVMNLMKKIYVRNVLIIFA